MNDSMKQLTDTIFYRHYPNIQLRVGGFDSGNMYTDQILQLDEEIYKGLLPLYIENFFDMICIYGYSKRLMDDLHDYIEDHKDKIGDAIVGYLRKYYDKHIDAKILSNDLSSAEVMDLLIHSKYLYIKNLMNSTSGATVKIDQNVKLLMKKVDQVFRSAYRKFCKNYLLTEVRRIFGDKATLETVYYATDKNSKVDSYTFTNNVIDSYSYQYFHLDKGLFINNFSRHSTSIDNIHMRTNILYMLLDLYYYGGSMCDSILSYDLSINRIMSFLCQQNLKDKVNMLLVSFVRNISAIELDVEDDRVLYFFPIGANDDLISRQMKESVCAVSKKQYMNFHMYRNITSVYESKRNNDHSYPINLLKYKITEEQVLDLLKEDDDALQFLIPSIYCKNIMDNFYINISQLHQNQNAFIDTFKNMVHYITSMYLNRYHQENVFTKLLNYKVYSVEDKRIYYMANDVKVGKNYPFWNWNVVKGRNVIEGNQMIDDDGRIFCLYSFEFTIDRYFDGPIQIAQNSKCLLKCACCCYCAESKEDCEILELIFPNKDIANKYIGTVEKDDQWLDLLKIAILSLLAKSYPVFKSCIISMDKLYHVIMDAAERDTDIHVNTVISYDGYNDSITKEDAINKLFIEYDYYSNYNLNKNTKRFIKFELDDG